MEQRIESARVVRDARQHRGHDHPRVHSRRRQPLEGPEPDRWYRRARFEDPNQRDIQRHERNVHLQIVLALDLREQIDVACDEWALGDEADRQPLAARQPLQHRAREPEAPFSGLVGVGGCPDDDRLSLALARGAPEIATQIAL
jgi:hypothetical protein